MCLNFRGGDTGTFGLNVLEAMASGIPVIGMNTGAVAELVMPETGVLLSSSTPHDLADAFTARFARDIARMGRAARHAVEEHWTWDCAHTGFYLTPRQRLLALLG